MFLILHWSYHIFQASPTKKLQPTRPVISFCTAVIIEVLGSLAVIDTDVVKRVLPYVVSGLQTPSKGNIDHKVRLKRKHFSLWSLKNMPQCHLWGPFTSLVLTCY